MAKYMYKYSFFKRLFFGGIFNDFGNISDGSDGKLIGGIILSAGVWIFALIMLFGTFGSLSEYERGFLTTFGKASNKIHSAGIYVKIPVIQSMKVYKVSVVREDANLSTYTKDIQTAEIRASVSYQINKDKIQDLWGIYGADWYDKLIWNNINHQAKDVIGKYNAEALVADREKAAKDILAAAKKSVEGLPVEFVAFQIINIDYNDSFESAVEKKVVAEQAAKESENKTKQIEQEAKQKLISAKAEAESMRIRSQALSQNPRLVDYEAVQKWDGRLPTTTLGNSVPFINLSK